MKNPNHHYLHHPYTIHTHTKLHSPTGRCVVELITKSLTHPASPTLGQNRKPPTFPLHHSPTFSTLPPHQFTTFSPFPPSHLTTLPTTIKAPKITTLHLLSLTTLVFNGKFTISDLLKQIHIPTSWETITNCWIGTLIC